MKHCAFCDFSSENPDNFDVHMRQAHAWGLPPATTTGPRWINPWAGVAIAIFLGPLGGLVLLAQYLRATDGGIRLGRPDHLIAWLGLVAGGAATVAFLVSSNGRGDPLLWFLWGLVFVPTLVLVQLIRWLRGHR